MFSQRCGLSFVYLCFFSPPDWLWLSRRWTDSFNRRDRLTEKERESYDVCGLCEDGRVVFLLPIHQCHSCWGCWCWWWCRLAAGHLCAAASSRLSCPGRVPPQSYGSSSWERSLEWLKRRRDTRQKMSGSWKPFSNFPTPVLEHYLLWTIFFFYLFHQLRSNWLPCGISVDKHKTQH